MRIDRATLAAFLLQQDPQDGRIATSPPMTMPKDAHLSLPEFCIARPTAIFLDFDGTLIDIALTPQAVAPPADISQLMARLAQALDGALAIITGRPVAELDRFLAPFRPRIAGVHGAQMRFEPDGEVEEPRDGLDPSIVSAVADLARRHPGVIAEYKGAAIALHYRLAEEIGPWLELQVQQIAAASPDRPAVRPGRKVIEVMPRRISKGGALERFMASPVFAGRRPIMVGDDASDESAFAAAQKFGGLGLRVAGEFFSRDRADFAGPGEVRAWLSRWVRQTAP